MKCIKRCLIFLFLCFSITAIYPQTSENSDTLYNRRIVWIGDEYVYRYAVQIDILENENYRSHLHEFTTASFLSVSLPAGEYRFRIIPHDILDRPQPGTQWVLFSVRAPIVPEIRDQAADLPAHEGEIQEIRTDNQETKEQSNLWFGTEINNQITEIEQPETELPETETRVNNPRFNTIGFSVGSGLADPLFIAAVHGTFAPIRYLFIELGCELGSLSMHDDVESIYSIFPFANLGVFLPFSEEGGFFAGTGGGYMLGTITFPEGKYDINIFGVNFFAGVNLFDMLNITYMLKTTFKEASHKIAVGLVYRFR